MRLSSDRSGEISFAAFNERTRAGKFFINKLHAAGCELQIGAETFMESQIHEIQGYLLSDRSLTKDGKTTRNEKKA